MTSKVTGAPSAAAGSRALTRTRSPGHARPTLHATDAGPAARVVARTRLPAAHARPAAPAWRNRRLSQRRAKSVKRFLVGLGVKANRLATQGYGERKLIARRCNRLKPRSAKLACHAKNRRVVFRILRTNRRLKGRSTKIKNR